jgi:hypothetical protein
VAVPSTKSSILSQAITLIRQLRRQITALQQQHADPDTQGHAPLSRAVSNEGTSCTVTIRPGLRPHVT